MSLYLYISDRKGRNIMRFFQRRYQENTTLLNICKYVADVCVVIVLAYVLVTFICCRSTVVGNSMEETLSNDNTVLINRISYAFNGPKRFDCIAFEQDSVDSSKIYIKRVVGLPGETVRMAGYILMMYSLMIMLIRQYLLQVQLPILINLQLMSILY